MKDLIGELCPSLSLVCVHCDIIHLTRNQYMLHCDQDCNGYNPANIMTKSLPCAKFSLCVDLVGLVAFNK